MLAEVAGELDLEALLADIRQAFGPECLPMNLPSAEKSGDSRERVVCDLVASMTDRYALALYEKLFFPSPLV